MELPITLKNAIEQEISILSSKQITTLAERVSCRYRNKERSGKPLLKDINEAKVYSLFRMPATFGAVSFVLKQLSFLYPNTDIKNCLDVGAGTGAVSWAVAEMFPKTEILAVEKEKAMRDIGKHLMTQAEFSPFPVWQEGDILNLSDKPSADLVVCSYVLNELSEKDKKTALTNLWNNTKNFLVLIDPGTPDVFLSFKKYRDFFIEKGAFIVAPCPHTHTCPILENDWCHFSCRIPRTKIHRQIKGGELAYEDEKFCYLILSKNPTPEYTARILRHPQIHNGHLTVTLCQNDGGITEKTIYKKEGDIYKKARKSSWGDIW
ncbi:MAG: methyltransferase domain-containing protein [Alphaproteobacteria bacterium]|nr:methyltransferase domain-containing protein [Alphaproteobacteria bacterium]